MILPEPSPLETRRNPVEAPSAARCSEALANLILLELRQPVSFAAPEIRLQLGSSMHPTAVRLTALAPP